MSRTKREKSGDTRCGFSWDDGKRALIDCPHICRLDYKHEGPHVCCSTEGGRTA